jgi:hypothetical protein
MNAPMQQERDAHRTDRHLYDAIPVVLLTGVGRSGTTALRESLGLHPDIHSTGRENNIIYDVLDAAVRNRTAPSRRYAMRVTDAVYDAAFRRLLLDLLWPDPRAVPPRRLMAFSDLTPDRAAYFTRLFPEGRTVCLVRNGVEVVSSRMRYDGFKDQPFESHCAVWSRGVELARWGAERPEFMLIRHEHLIADGGAEREVARLCQFVGLGYASICAAHLRGTTYHPTPNAARGDADRSLATRSDRWRDWSPEQTAVFNQVCAGAMAYLGYPRPPSARAPLAA